MRFSAIVTLTSSFMLGGCSRSPVEMIPVTDVIAIQLEDGAVSPQRHARPVSVNQMLERARRDAPQETVTAPLVLRFLPGSTELAGDGFERLATYGSALGGRTVIVTIGPAGGSGPIESFGLMARRGAIVKTAMPDGTVEAVRLDPALSVDVVDIARPRTPRP